MARFRTLFRDHLPFLVIMPILIVVMTYPTIIHVFDTDTFWLPARDRDAFIHTWNGWHLKQVLAGEASLFHTNSLFYPQGLSLVYTGFSFPHMIMLCLLQLIMPTANAYCLSFLLVIFCNALCGYIYCFYLAKDKWQALAGAVIFGCSQQVMGNFSAAPVSFYAGIALTVYFLHRGIDECSTRRVAIAGLLFGATAWSGMYIFVCNALTVALVLPFFGARRWRDKTFWRDMALMGMLAFVVSAGRVLPMLSDSGEVSRIIGSDGVRQSASELMAYGFNYRHPVLSPMFHAVFGVEPVKQTLTHKSFVHGDLLTVYIGYITLLLTGVALARKTSRGRALPWLAIGAFFLVLRLGTTLQINGVVYPDILLPKHLLDQLLPMIVGAFYSPTHLYIGALLPLAVLATLGLGAVLPGESRRRRVITLLVVALVAFELYYLPLTSELDYRRFDYISWLKTQPHQDSIRLLELPMDTSEHLLPKERLLHQTMHGYPIAGGYISRIPEAAFAYIDANPLLSAWRRDRGVVCGAGRQGEISAALDAVQADGFSHVVLSHGAKNAAPFLASFADIAPAYADRYTHIYKLSQLRESCEDPPPGADSLALQMEFVYGDVIPPRDEAVLTFHPSERLNEDALRYLSWNADFGKNLSHVTVDGAGRLSLQSANPAMQSVDDIAAQDTLLLLGEPDAAGEPGSAWMNWLADRFQRCQRLAESERIVIDHYLSRDLPCELVAAAEKLELLYDNGSRLLNRTLEIDDEALRLHLWWRIADGRKSSYSIQVFDASGMRARQADHVMNRSMTSHTIDLTDLPAGEYQARLIVYDFESGASHGGAIVSDSTRFERDIEIARFWLER